EFPLSPKQYNLMLMVSKPLPGRVWLVFCLGICNEKKLSVPPFNNRLLTLMWNA
ncbi:MAG: hypothetical protein ACI92Z_003821, partial [Paracoccaceae bacterium]